MLRKGSGALIPEACVTADRDRWPRWPQRLRRARSQPGSRRAWTCRTPPRSRYIDRPPLLQCIHDQHERERGHTVQREQRHRASLLVPPWNHPPEEAETRALAPAVRRAHARVDACSFEAEGNEAKDDVPDHHCLQSTFQHAGPSWSTPAAFPRTLEGYLEPRGPAAPTVPARGSEEGDSSRQHPRHALDPRPSDPTRSLHRSSQRAGRCQGGRQRRRGAIRHEGVSRLRCGCGSGGGSGLGRRGRRHRFYEIGSDEEAIEWGSRSSRPKRSPVMHVRQRGMPIADRTSARLLDGGPDRVAAWACSCGP